MSNYTNDDASWLNALSFSDQTIKYNVHENRGKNFATSKSLKEFKLFALT